MARILFIDDDPITLSMLTKIVKLFGHESITAVGAFEGVDIAVAEQPDLIFFDMNMPEMNGLDLLRTLRTKEETKNIPALMLSASADFDTEEHVLAAGGQGYLQKPINLDTLHELIKKYALKPQDPAND